MRQSLSVIVFTVVVLLSSNSFAELAYTTSHWQALGTLNGMGFAFTVDTLGTSYDGMFGVANISHDYGHELPGTSTLLVNKVGDHYELKVNNLVPINLGTSNQFDFYCGAATGYSMRQDSPVDYTLTWYYNSGGLSYTLGTTRIFGAAPVPIPSSALLLGLGLLGLVGFGSRRRGNRS